MNFDLASVAPLKEVPVILQIISIACIKKRCDREKKWSARKEYPIPPTIFPFIKFVPATTNAIAPANIHITANVTANITAKSSAASPSPSVANPATATPPANKPKTVTIAITETATASVENASANVPAKAIAPVTELANANVPAIVPAKANAHANANMINICLPLCPAVTPEKSAPSKLVSLKSHPRISAFRKSAPARSSRPLKERFRKS
ncbi:hypothetical protein APA_3530 [Pseudanabaena sp. lw0831]|nr:hypothetical protein APA_3530 [Pseudanabaena sp. lw0831]